MYARQVSLKLKPEAAEKFAQKFEHDVMPLLRKQTGFQDEITLTSREGKEAVGISLWDRKENADAYEKTAYRDVAKLLAPLTDGEARVQTFEVRNSTIHKIFAGAKS
jgi:heme-degrading monooxygenase HmoA